MDVGSNLLTATRYPRTPSRRAILAPRSANARAIVTLALCTYGLAVAVDQLGAPWAGLVRTVVLALLAAGCFVAASRAHDHRVGWLLSGSVAAGLAIVAFSNVVGATPELAQAGVVACAAIPLLALRAARQRR